MSIENTKDNDAIVLEDSAAAAVALDVQYRRALLTPGTDFKTIGEQADDAAVQYTKARKNLLAEGVLATNDDIVEIRRIRMGIEKAISTQQAIEGGIQFLAFIAKFV